MKNASLRDVGMRAICKSFPLFIFAMAAAAGLPAEAAECGPLKIITSVQMTSVGSPGDVATIPVIIAASPRRLLVDTGSFQSMVTKRTVGELNLQTTTVSGGVSAVDVSGSSSRSMAQLPSITLGNLRQENVYFFVQPGDANPKDTSTPPFDGLLGQDLFQKVDVDLDYGINKLTLISQDHCPGKVVYWSGSEPTAIVPFTIDRGGHIVIRLELDGKRLTGWLDTGATNTLLNLEAARQIFSLDRNSPDLEKVGQLNGNYTANVYRRRFKSLSFGAVSVTDPTIELIPDFLTQGASQPVPTGSLIRTERQGLPDMILGMSIISKLHLYIANGERKLYITKANRPSQ